MNFRSHRPHVHGRRLRSTPREDLPVTHQTFRDALQRILPDLMETRVKSWGQPGREVSPQQDSPFYNGRIPQEITDLIFEYALSPDVVPGPVPPKLLSEDGDHDFCVRYDHKRASDEPEIQPPAVRHENPEDGDGNGNGNGNDGAVGPLPGALTLQQAGQGHDPNAGTATPPPRHRTMLEVRMQQGLGFDWYRPEVATRNVFRGKSLLQTCRRVYLDANKFLATHQEAVIWQGREPHKGESFSRFSRRLRQDYEQSQLRRTRSMRVYAQMYQLEWLAKDFNKAHKSVFVTDMSAESVNSYWHLRSLLSSGEGPIEPLWRMFYNLQEFHLTLRRTDWYLWEDNRQLAIDVYSAKFAAPDIGAMRERMRVALEGGGEQPAFEDQSLGTMFRIMANLKKLTISFETSEDKADEMEEIVRWARTWRFEIMSWRHWMMQDNHEVMAHLVCDDRPVRRMSWRGLRHHWADICPNCSTHITRPRDECPYCQKREALLRDGKGPRLLVWTLTWKPRPVDPPISLADTEERKMDDQ